MTQNIRLGSAFSGIGGFELGLHWAIPNLQTVWQIEKDKFCQKVLKKHWPNSQLHEDITTINTKELSDIDILCAGFPCTDLSEANIKGKGLYGKKSGLFWDLCRIIRDFRNQKRQIPIILLENVTGLTFRGLGTVLGEISQIGYSIEFFTVKARSFGAPHIRERWFGICYIANPHISSTQEQSVNPWRLETESRFKRGSGENDGVYSKNYWQEGPIESPLCSLDDGISNRMARLKALGNAIVPQCSEWIGKRLIETGLIEECIYRNS